MITLRKGCTLYSIQPDPCIDLSISVHIKLCNLYRLSFMRMSLKLSISFMRRICFMTALDMLAVAI